MPRPDSRLLRQEKIDLVLTDLKLPRMDGLEFLQTVKRSNATLPVILMTAYGTVETAIEAMKAGASDYVLKPFSMEEIKLIIRKELDVRRLREENRDLREALGERYRFENIVAQSAKMQEVLAVVERVAPTNSTVLLGGESGVGKDMIARAIHQHSRRASGPFIKINCTAIPENLLESELFGYEKGAFTGAMTAKPGKFELADKGTIFLDEIGDVPGAIQVKLLRVLQEREFERLGGTKTLKVDVRVVAATNQDLRAALEQGTFREDLYYRLNVVPISIPPLREHKEDIPYLADHFLARFARESAKPDHRHYACAHENADGFPLAGQRPGTRKHHRARRGALHRHHAGRRRHPAGCLPGAAVIARTSAADAADLSCPGMTLEQYEDEIIKEALRRANGNKSQAARLLGLSRNAFRYRCRNWACPMRKKSRQRHPSLHFWKRSCGDASRLQVICKALQGLDLAEAHDFLAMIYSRDTDIFNHSDSAF